MQPQVGLVFQLLDDASSVEGIRTLEQDLAEAPRIQLDSVVLKFSSRSIYIHSPAESVLNHWRDKKLGLILTEVSCRTNYTTRHHTKTLFMYIGLKLVKKHCGDSPPHLK
jgi:hypothetical protein